MQFCSIEVIVWFKILPKKQIGDQILPEVFIIKGIKLFDK